MGTKSYFSWSDIGGLKIAWITESLRLQISLVLKHKLNLRQLFYVFYRRSKSPLHIINITYSAYIMQ